MDKITQWIIKHALSGSKQGERSTLERYQQMRNGRRRNR